MLYRAFMHGADEFGIPALRYECKPKGGSAEPHLRREFTAGRRRLALVR